MMRRALAVACLLGFTAALSAQQPAQSPSYTQMIVGVGHTLDEAAWSLGFEHKPTDSRVAWRVLLEHWDNHTNGPGSDNWQARRLFGAQLVGLRQFRQQRRVQPYLLGGLAIYHEEYFFGSRNFTFGPDGFIEEGPVRTGRGERVNPSIIWGTGLNVRVSGFTMFGELKLPMPVSGQRFRAAPFLFGIRF